jgi:hypothetical protein
MFYTGWSLAKIVPFTFFIGLAISDDKGKTYARYSEAPILGRNIHDPFLTAAPWVIKDEGIFKMWYISCRNWELAGDGTVPKHYYRVKYAESRNAVDWDIKGVAVDFQDDEYAIARPTVRKVNGVYQMWFCSRGGQETYRLRYAESSDGVSWNRKEKFVGLDVSDSGWDSEMICYPSVFEFNGNEYMLYNGNGYGATGVGLAIREE